MSPTQPAQHQPTAEGPLLAALAHFGSPRPDHVGRSFTAPDVAACDAQGMLGVTSLAVDEGWIVLSPDAEAMLVTLLERATAEAVILESRAATAIAALHEEGIATRALKGVAASRLDYDDPGLRHFGDIDLLVRGEDMSDAVRSLSSRGYHRHFPEPFDGFDEHIGKGVAVSDRSGTVFDLHRTLALGYYGTRLPVEDLWHDPDTFELAGQTVSALPGPLRFVHSALHLALAPAPKMSNGLDLVMLARTNPELVSGSILDIVERWRCRYPVSQAVAMTVAWFGDDWAPDDLIRWSRSQRPAAIDRVAMSAFHGRIASSRLRSLTAVAGLQSGAERRRALRGLLSQRHNERE